jgi:peptidoglycan hydrolase FlgJ
MNPIQNSINRFSVDESKLNELKQKTSFEKNSKFQDELNSEIFNSIEGKVSSSNIKINSNIKEEIKIDPYRKKLFNASVEFESIFVKMMLNQMKKSINKSGLIDGGYAEEIFEDFLYDEYAKKISENHSLGLAEQIYDTLSKSLPKLDLKS